MTETMRLPNGNQRIVCQGIAHGSLPVPATYALLFNHHHGTVRHYCRACVDSIRDQLNEAARYPVAPRLVCAVCHHQQRARPLHLVASVCRLPDGVISIGSSLGGVESHERV